MLSSQIDPGCSLWKWIYRLVWLDLNPKHCPWCAKIVCVIQEWRALKHTALRSQALDPASPGSNSPLPIATEQT